MLTIACFQIINVTISGTSAGLGVYSLRIEPVAVCCKSSVALFKRVWLSEGESLVYCVCVWSDHK